jgi:hypothetical protein
MTYAEITTVPTAVAQSSDCTGEECALECRRGQLAACTREADLVAGKDLEAATRRWLELCDQREPTACARAMSVASAAAADEAAAHACASGIKTACGLLGRAQLVRGAARHDRDDQAALIDDASILLQQACGPSDWHACITAWVAYVVVRGEPGKQEAARLLARGRLLAGKACADDDPAACHYLAGVHDTTDPAQASTYRARACALALAGVKPDAVAMRSEIEGGEDCRRAAEAHVELPAIPPAPAGSPVLERVSGDVKIVPDEKIKTALWKQGRKQLSAYLQVCASPFGLVDRVAILDSSGAPAWDLALFDAVRRWRFRPYRAVGAEPVCGLYIFRYSQL